ncbi:ABC-three component system protein [Pleionea sp. CnH1-48]|uniref:ABC-three component system protein n=1 Tax=Pleionea sp. CnH1-48 TaxID=2954494 RepID=UPI002097B04E|nr:ABC-three component system protein [Pleionea sp. CnH1-48]MCO7226630.1 hypothetical protein [Pleionea sp. CnH1-48]
MASKARQYKPSHVRRLDTLSGNECAAPDCVRALIARDGETIISKICHIEAASKNGPRFNPAMSDDERRHYNNLILMCDECHEIIDNLDNEQKYPVSLLQEWKKEHEAKILSRLQSKPSLLKLAINAISEINFESESPEKESHNKSIAAFKIEDKIQYNSVIRNRPLIEEYKIFYIKIASLYSELEANGSFRKNKLLRNIERLYLKVKGKYITNFDNQLSDIQKNADNIIEDIEEELLNTCDSYNSLCDEDISFGISIIMVDAFMRCKILEEPPKS